MLAQISRASVWHCCFATPRSGFFRPISCRCRRLGSPARSTRRHIPAGCATGRRRRCYCTHGGAARAAHPHQYRQQASGRGRGSHCGDADGHPARSHAGAGLGTVAAARRGRRRADGDRLSMVAVGRRDFRADRLRRGRARRLRQRARLALCRPDHRADPGGFRLLAGAIYKDIVVYGLFVALLWFGRKD